MKILLIDDNRLSLKVLQTQLRQSGHVVKTATHGKQGLRLFRENAIDYFSLVVIDHDMPKMTGSECIKLLRRRGYRGHIMGLSCDRRNNAKFLNVGANVANTKPFQPTMLNNIR